MNVLRLEICANSLASCLEAERGGAARIELCAGIPEGGTTPSIGTVVAALELLSIPIYPIIRPRGGDFLYSKEEIDIMECDIRMLIDLGVPGIVIGALTPQGTLDKEVCKRLIEAAQGRDVTLHRAFDMTRDLDEALDDAISLGFGRVLTSGGTATAHQGIPTLRRLVERSAGAISIMPGCGITSANICDIARLSGAKEFHASLRTTIPSQMIYHNPLVSMGGSVTIDEYSQPQTSAALVSEVVQILTDIPQ